MQIRRRVRGYPPRPRTDIDIDGGRTSPAGNGARPRVTRPKMPLRLVSIEHPTTAWQTGRGLKPHRFVPNSGPRTEVGFALHFGCIRMQTHTLRIFSARPFPSYPRRTPRVGPGRGQAGDAPLRPAAQGPCGAGRPPPGAFLKGPHPMDGLGAPCSASGGWTPPPGGASGKGPAPTSPGSTSPPSSIPSSTTSPTTPPATASSSSRSARVRGRGV